MTKIKMIFYLNSKSKVYFFIYFFGMLISILCEVDIEHKFVLGFRVYCLGFKCLVVSFKVVFSANSFTPTFVLVKFFLNIYTQ